MSEQPVYYTGKDTQSFFRYKHNTTIFLVLALALFFLPFVQIKCGSMTLLENSGVGLAIGGKWNSPLAGSENDMKKLGAGDDIGKGKTGSAPMIIVILSILAAVVSLVSGLSTSKQKNLLGICASSLAGLLLIALLVYLKISLGSMMAKESNQEAAGLIKVGFTIWFYLAVLFFFAAAYISFKKFRMEEEDERQRLLYLELGKESH